LNAHGLVELAAMDQVDGTVGQPVQAFAIVVDR
jgi:hypothetical protein